MARPRNGDVSFQVLKFVEAHAGKRVNIEDVQAATGFTVSQVQQAMNRIINERRWPVHVIIRGRVWRASETDFERQPAKIFSEDGWLASNAAPNPVIPAPAKADPPKVDPPPLGETTSDKPYVPMGWRRDGKGWRLVPETVEDIKEFTDKLTPEPSVEDLETSIPLPLPSKPDVLNDPTTTIYEVLGARPDGKLIIRSHLGDFYLATLEKI